MTAAEFRRQWQKWTNLLAYARRVNDAGGEARCERELTALAEVGARGMTGEQGAEKNSENPPTGC
jgi:hypothetical protein